MKTFVMYRKYYDSVTVIMLWCQGCQLLDTVWHNAQVTFISRMSSVEIVGLL